MEKKAKSLRYGRLGLASACSANQRDKRAIFSITSGRCLGSLVLGCGGGLGKPSAVTSGSGFLVVYLHSVLGGQLVLVDSTIVHLLSRTTTTKHDLLIPLLVARTCTMYDPMHGVLISSQLL